MGTATSRHGPGGGNRLVVMPLRFLSLFVLVMVMMGCPWARAAGRPNIVFFIADDMSIKDSSVYGNTDIPGPNMAALAKEGLTFDRAYATSPTCAPSRAALLTGRYNLRNGVMFNHQPATPEVKKWPAYF